MTHQELAQQFLSALRLDEERVRRVNIEFAVDSVPIITVEFEMQDVDGIWMEKALTNLKRFELSEVSTDLTTARY